MRIDRAQRALLLDVARDAILGELRAARDARIQNPSTADEPLGAPGASFVTLTLEGRLRGCCGSIEARRALLDDVRVNARLTAFSDPRFPPLALAETAGAELEISVLGPLESMDASSERAILAELRPGIDGLLISYGSMRSTFLPKVWEALPDPQTFLRQLKRKMGVADDFWASGMVAKRYATESFAGALVTREH